MQGIRARLRIAILLSYVVVAFAQAWPLPLHLSTALTGPPSGDTGVYIWNTWVFRHELVIDGHDPFHTETILPLDGPTDLSLHNYTVFADLLALPIQGRLGVVATFNLIYLLNTALAGLGMFLLARRVTGRVAESWIAGCVFACSPFLVARSMAHFSLAGAAPLPFFVYWFDRAWASGRLRDGCLAGAMVAWAGFCDPYYAIYCAMLAVLITAGRLVTVTARRHTPNAAARVSLDAALLALAALVLTVHVLAHGELHLGGRTLTMHSLYTPVFLFTLLALARALIVFTPRVSWRAPVEAGHLALAGAAGAVTAACLLAPELLALAARIADGRMVSVPVLWRSSAPGIDLLSFFLPNPNHPLAPAAIVNWLTRQPGNYEENVASFSIVAIAIIAVSWRRAHFRPSRLWTAITLGFMSLALGPFLQIAGVRTFVPTPWTLLRYVPLVDEARMPPRFAVVAILGFTVVFASALVALVTRFPAARRRILVGVSLALAFELLPVPRRLYSAAVPAIYRTIAADPRPIRVLELPFGVRDGLSSLGDFTAASQFYQTMHRKALIGGYLSRVEASTKASLLSMPIPAALLTFSEGGTPSPEAIERAHDSATSFISTSQLGYVVMDRGRVSSALRSFAITTLGLVSVGESGQYELFTPTAPRVHQIAADGHGA